VQEAGVLMTGLAECVSNLALHCIVSSKVTEPDRAKMERVAGVLNVELFFYDPVPILGKFERSDKSQIRFQKLVHNEILPSNLPKILYLDIDTLPIRDVSSLFELEFPQAFAAVALDDVVSRKFVRWRSVANSGVILFNSKVWNSEELNLRARDFMANYYDNQKSMLDSDELVLNKVYYDRWFRIPSIYNCSFLRTYTSSYLFNPRKIRIVHFIGPEKIWKKDFNSIRYLRFVRIYQSRLRLYNSLLEPTNQHY
jgi:lipopolysaccharide biosynthesis glycosyltransferase